MRITTVKTQAKAALMGLLALTIASCSKTPSELQYQADIRYTEFGVPHITARDYASLGYAVGQAHARDNLCTLAEQMRNLKAERARYLGAGEKKQNIIHDVVYRAWNLPEQAAQNIDKLSQKARDLLRGYSDGFNAHLANLKSPQDYPSPCRGAEWVQPITPELLLAYQFDLAMLSSSRAFIEAIAAAHPPTEPQQLSAVLNAEHVLTSEGIGSNGWALGKERVAQGNSALIANPHYPWDGELRFYQQHLTIPGELDVMGVGMIGLPAVSIGFNQHVAWTHTVSQSKRFTLYKLELDPKNPLRYRYGDNYRDIKAQTVEIQVKQADESLKPYQHTLYNSHYGAVLNLASLSPSLGWNQSSAITMRDANLGNLGMLEQWLDMNTATNIDDLFAAFERHQAIPWVNTMMVDSQGEAAYIDGSQAPALSDKAEAYWREVLTKPEVAPLWRDGAGVILLPGSDPEFEWQELANSRSAGVVNFEMAPKLRRHDYVFNANSSHWLSHVEEPLEGYSIAFGPEQTHRSPRTRYNAQLISNTSSTGPAGEDGKFDLAELKQVFSSNGSLFGGNLRIELQQRCELVKSIELEGELVTLEPACAALKAWDGRYTLESRGAHLMREFLSEFRVKGHRDISDDLFERSFDPSVPASTPSGLRAAPSSAPDPVLQALARAAQRLEGAGIKLDAALGEVQYVIKAQGKQRIPITGGYSFESVFNYAQARDKSRGHGQLASVQLGNLSFPKSGSTLRALDEDGDGVNEQAYRVNYGSSFVMALIFEEQGPKAEMFLSYGQSHDPESPHFVDQTLKYSQLEWRPVLFKPADVESNTQELIELRIP